MSAVLSFVLKLKKNDLKYKLCPYSYVGRLIFTYETRDLYKSRKRSCAENSTAHRPSDERRAGSQVSWLLLPNIE